MVSIETIHENQNDDGSGPQITTKRVHVEDAVGNEHPHDFESVGSTDGPFEYAGEGDAPISAIEALDEAGVDLVDELEERIAPDDSTTDDTSEE